MSVESRIVTMKFDNVAFERAAAVSLGTLGKIKEALNFKSVGNAAISGLGKISGVLSKFGLKNPFANTQKGVQQLAGEAGRFNLSPMEGAITSVSKSWLALTTVALTAISNITTAALASAGNWVKGFTFGPIMDGLHEYETNLKAIQTIQANTDRPLTEINKSLDQLNAYSDQTIYNFGEMAKNIGTFTAAGVDLQTSVSSIKGIANMAALSGSTSQQAATAMYQLSQAISSGRVGLQDWNSVVNAGMGGKKLQNALAQTAIAMGKVDAAQVKGTKSGEQLKIAGQSFRESIMAKPGQESWLTSGILVNTLKTLDGRFSAAALSQEELSNGTLRYKTKAEQMAKIEQNRNKLAKEGIKFSDAQFAEIMRLSDASFEAAQKVKTLGQVFDIAKETIGSGWSASFRNIFGNLNEAKKTFTGLSDYIGDFIKTGARARNEMLSNFHDMGGRTELIKGIKAAFTALFSVLGPIKDAFRDIFPKKSAADLFNMVYNFRLFAESLKVSGSTADKIHRTFAGLFAVLSIFGKIIGGVARGIGQIFKAAGEGSGGFLNFTAGIGDALVALNDFLAESDIIGQFFTSLGKILSLPVKLITGFAHILGSMFSGFDSSGAEKVQSAVHGFSTAMTPLQALGQRLGEIFRKVGDIFSRIGDVIGDALSGIGTALSKAITPETFTASLDVINTALLGGIVIMLKKFFSGGMKVDFGGGIFSGIKETLGAATGALKNMQTSIKADILMKIAIALGILSAALFVLSTIDDKALAKALAAMSGGFAALIGVMVALMKVLGDVGIVQIYVISAALTKLATAILILSLALKILSSIPLDQMIKGLIGMAAMLFIVQKAMIPMAAGSKGMGKAAGSLILLGIALNLMAIALKIFASMSWEEIAHGLAATAGLLVILAAAMRLMPKGMVLQAAGLLIISAALNGLGLALKIFNTMSWDEMIHGLSAVAGMLAILAAAMRLMPASLPITAAGLVLVSVALNIMAGALKVMGSMGWEEIAKGLTVLAGAMIILAVGLNAIGVVGTIGAVGLAAAAASLSILAPTLVILGAMPWENIIKGLVGLAGVFTILGLAGLILAPLTPVLIGLGIALTLMGAGLALAGVGALAFGTAFGIIVATGTAGIQLLGGMLATVIKAIPKAMEAFAKGLVGFVQKIANSGPKLVGSMAKIIGSMISAVIRNVPKMGKAFSTMINTAIRVIGNAVPKLINLGFKLIISFLNAISRNIGRITNIAASIIVKFLNGIARNIGRIIQAGVNLIIKFVNGVSRAIEKNSSALGAAGGRLGVAMVRGMARGITSAAGTIADAALDAAQAAFKKVKDFFHIGSPSKLFRDEVGARLPQGTALGIDDEAHLPVQAIERMGGSAMDAMRRTMEGVSDAMRLEGDMNPTISPVLDLTALTKEANKMSAILDTVPVITANVSYAQAASISDDYSRPRDDGSGGGGGDTTYNYTQNLHSPRAISAVDAYRQGKSLFALKKEALQQ